MGREKKRKAAMKKERGQRMKERRCGERKGNKN